MIKCIYCNRENKDGSVYCSQCGKKLPQTEVCGNPKCRNPLPIGATFCPECGTRVLKNVEKQEEPVSATKNVVDKQSTKDDDLGCLLTLFFWIGIPLIIIYIVEEVLK